MTAGDSLATVVDLGSGTTGSATWSTVGFTADPSMPPEYYGGVQPLVYWHRIHVTAAGTCRFGDDPSLPGDSTLRLYRGPATPTDYTDLTFINFSDDEGGNTKPVIYYVSPGGEWLYLEHAMYTGTGSETLRWDLDAGPPSIRAYGNTWVEVTATLITGNAVHSHGVAAVTVSGQLANRARSVQARGAARAYIAGEIKRGVRVDAGAQVRTRWGLPGPQTYLSGVVSNGAASARLPGLSGNLHIPAVTIPFGQVRGAGGAVPDLSGNPPVSIALQLYGELQRIPQPPSIPPTDPAVTARTMQSIVLTLPTPAIVNGRPVLPRYWAKANGSASLRVGPKNIHAVPDPDPVWAGGAWFYPPPPATGVGDARWSVRTLPDPGDGYYWLGDATSADGTARITPAARQWAPDPATPHAAAWRSFFPYKPSVRASDHFLPNGNVVHHPKGVHFNAHYIEHMWADFGRPTTGPSSWVMAAMVMNYPTGGFTHYLLDAGRNPDAVGFPRLSASAVNTPRRIADGLDYRNLIAVSSSNLYLCARPSLSQGKTVVARYDATVRPKMFFGVFNGSASYVGAYDTVARRIQKGPLDPTNFGTNPHRFFVIGRSQGWISQAYAGNFLLFEIRYWNHALTPADLAEQYQQLSATYKFNEYRAV